LGACVGSLGSYTEEKIISADKLVPLPSSVDDVMAASIMLKGMTAQMLLRRVFKVLSSLNLLILSSCIWFIELLAMQMGTDHMILEFTEFYVV
jgi:NADPH:quinone reductase-like Zn-dependent oxidoreductase